MSRLSTTTGEDWLDIVHAGEILLSEFIDPHGLTVPALANALHVEADRLTAVVSGSHVIDAELDLRLSRYFNMSEGFFLRLQNRHDTLAAKRAMNGELDRITPLAA